MPDAASGVAKIDNRDDSYRAIVSDLTSLIEQVRNCTKRVELAIASEALPGDQDVAAKFVMLDDVTPRYARTTTALNTCNAGLTMALHFLRDTGTSEPGMDGSAGSGRLRLV
jgi:hypothetical protein